MSGKSNESEIQYDAMTSIMEYSDDPEQLPTVALPEMRIADALNMIMCNGGIDGAHHKQWVLDQVVRILCGDEDSYCVWVGEYEGPEKDHELDEEYEGHMKDYEWDEGCPP